jgi:chemotaxis protein MotB
MGKKKHPEHVNHERWLVSYADFITQLAAAMQTAFTPMAMFEAHSKTPAITSGAGASDALTPTPIQPPLPTADQIAAHTAAGDTQAFITKMLTEKNPANRLPPGSITMHTTQEGLVISLHEAGFFASGSSEIQPSSMNLLTRLAASLPPGPLRVEGHTDNIPIHTAQFASNWELSTARATTIARLLLDHPNIHPGNLSAAGYAEFHPVASNATEAGRAQNRRVDIILLRSPAPSQ